MIEFAKYTAHEQEIADAIVKRARELWAAFGMTPTSSQTLQMDLAATHSKVPLRLQDLLDADDFDFTHDIGGIMRHMDRTTGKLGGCFLPRFAEADAWQKSIASGGGLSVQDVIDTEARRSGARRQRRERALP